MNHYFFIYKPYQVLSQFSAVEGKQTLADFFDVPGDVYPVGRLDYDSEGLLILTNDKALNHRLLDPKFLHEREYWVQVDGAIQNEHIADLEKGVAINLDAKMYTTLPCKAKLFQHNPAVFERNPPIRYRKEIPAPWIQLILKEGKNRQVRKMTAKIGFPTLRLIRNRIEDLCLEKTRPGEIVELTLSEIHKKLFHAK
jgi:23S rRNA pseudouridine2457 synthase